MDPDRRDPRRRRITGPGVLAASLASALVLTLSGPAAARPDTRPPAASVSDEPVIVPGTLLVPAKGRPSAVPGQAPADLSAAQLRAAAEAAAEAERSTASTPAPSTTSLQFGVGTFNILGHAHTVRSGNKARWPASARRTPAAAALIRDSGVSVVGLSEVEPAQSAQLRRALPSWELWPLRGDARWGRQPIGWDSRVWSRTASEAIRIPYLGGHPIWIPAVLLTHRRTGREVWIVNTHNAADARGPAERLRNIAEARQIALINRLQRQAPVIFTGDMNNGNDFLCHVAPRTGMRSADGGGAQAGGGCARVPDPAIDWVLGTSQIVFSEYVRDRSPARRRIADHPFVHATASIG